ncbi:MAG: hypothetical protein DRJ40_10045 [Thermoprotei archaeon]|nr:MAG: hypothetical protein DRJ40_10045 [Thermoprotei archaeon]
MSTRKRVLRTVIVTAITIQVALTLVFIIVNLLPGSPLNALDILAGNIPSDVRKKLEDRLGLGSDIVTRYIIFLRSVLTFDFGYSISIHYMVPTSSILPRYLAITLILMIPAITLAAVISLVLAVVTTPYVGTTRDYVVTTLMIALYSVPPYWLGMVLQYIVAYKLGILPASGVVSEEGTVLDMLRHLVLPLTTLTLWYSGLLYIVTKSVLAPEYSTQYVLLARAKGLSRYAVVWRHVLRANAAPLISLIALLLGFSVSGMVSVERVFSWEGTGYLIAEAELQRDYTLIYALFTVLTLSVVLANSVADIAIAVLHPRQELAPDGGKVVRRPLISRAVLKSMYPLIILASVIALTLPLLPLTQQTLEKVATPYAPPIWYTALIHKTKLPDTRDYVLKLVERVENDREAVLHYRTSINYTWEPPKVFEVKLENIPKYTPLKLTLRITKPSSEEVIVYIKRKTASNPLILSSLDPTLRIITREKLWKVIDPYYVARYVFSEEGEYKIDLVIKVLKSGNENYLTNTPRAVLRIYGLKWGLLGTDAWGRDVASEIALGLVTTLCVGAIISLLSTTIGTVVGVVASYFSKLVGTVLMRICDIVLILPTVPLLIVLSCTRALSPVEIGIVVGSLKWGFVARVVYSASIRVCRESYVESARAIGLGSWSILVNYVIPAISPTIAAMAILQLAYGIQIECIASFLGLTSPEYLSIGQVLRYVAYTGAVALDAWWWFIPPGVVIGLLTAPLLIIAYRLVVSSRGG